MNGRDSSREINPGICRQIVRICLLILLLCVSISALDRDRALNQFHHTAWVAKDGAPSQISALAQTADGYLWIGSALGLFRFDGVRFEQYQPPDGTRLPSRNIYALMATPDGGLWISFRPSGLGFLKDGQLKVFTRPEELPKTQVYTFARTPDDRIWAGTHDGLYFFTGAGWTEIGAEWDFTPNRVRHLLTDRDGTLWAATEKYVAYLPSGSKNFQLTAETNTAVQLAQAKDGRLWQVGYLEPVWVKTVKVKSSDTEVKISQNAIDLIFDREGGLWTAAYPIGIARVSFPEQLETKTIKADDKRIQRFNEADGLSGNQVTNILEDQEGNIWVGTTKGLDRFRYSPIVPVSLPQGYQKLTLLAAENGGVWAASAGGNPLLRIGNGIIRVGTGDNNFVSSVYRATNGDVWWGGYDQILLQQNDRIKSFPQPGDLKKDWMWEVIRGNTDGGLWINFGDVGLMYFKDGEWTHRKPPEGLPDRGPSASFHDATGRIWLGYTENRVFIMDSGGGIRGYSSADGIEIGRIKVIRGRGANFWFGGELGLAHFANDRFYTVKTYGEPFGTISGIVATENGDLWLNEVRGIVNIPASEIRQLNEDPVYAVKYRLFDFEDNMPGGPQMNYTVSTAVEATDGLLWFATDNGLAQIDPANIMKNPLPPPVSIRSISTDDKTFQFFEDLRFPAGTHDLRINYTALCLSVPERVQFKYRLVGSDDDWREAGDRREAFYTNLGPGKYRFQVIAANNDGIWNEDGAFLEFEILPRFYQTRWFIVLCLIAFAILILAGFRWRVHMVKYRLHLQFEERLAERTRIAQELHDSLLQGFISVAMQMSVAVENMPDELPSKQHFNRILELMNRVKAEGRNTLRGLRPTTNKRGESIELAFAEFRQNLGARDEIDFRLLVEGAPRPLRLIIREEVFQIGREALINSFRHSKAMMIEVIIEYSSKRFKILVHDDGCGIDPRVLQAGRDGHWGLSGMRERAKKIGGQLEVRSQTATGTEVELTIPGHIAFETPIRNHPFNWLNNLYRRRKEISLSEKEQDV